MRKLALAALFVFIPFLNLRAQSTPVSQVSGVVRDAESAAVPGARVTITNVDTAASRTAESGEDGAYTFPNLTAGPYKLQVEKSGFVSYVQTGITLTVDSNPKINVVMKIGEVSQSIAVQADAIMVETQSAGVGQLIDQKRVVDLPLNGRNVTQLITLSGGAVSGVNPNSSGTNASQGGIATNLNYPTVAAFSVAGGQANATNYFLDGGSHLDVRTNVGLPLPFPDALQEFKVETSSLPANYGSHPGGVVSAITKSGTNSIHGDLFEFLRNYAVNAQNPFATAASRDLLKRNQFGGVVGGPVIKDKIFFFAGFQGTIERTSTTTTSYVPTAAVLAGDFSTIMGPSCIPVTPAKPPVYLPTTLNGNAFATSPTSNILAIPENPVALALLKLLPVSTDPCGSLTYALPQDDNEYQGVTRADWRRTDKDSIFFRFFVADYGLKAIYDKSNLLTATNPGLADRVTTANIGDTYLIKSNLVSSFRFTFTRSAVQRFGASGVPTMTSLGSAVTSPIPNYTGQIQIPNYFSTGAIPGFIYTNTYGVSEDLVWIHGAHQFEFGFNLFHTRLNALGPFQMNPRMTFNGNQSKNGLADFVTGNIDTFLQGNGQVGRDHQTSPSLYVLDKWRVNSRFQINAGLRWDPFVPQHQILGYASSFDPAAFTAGTVSKSYTNAPPGLTFPGDAGFPGQSDTFPRYGDFAPRFGISYDPRGKGTETIRAGYGLFYDSSYLWNTLHMPLNPPWGETLSFPAPVLTYSSTTPTGGLSNPWQNPQAGGPNPFPTPINPPSNFVFPTAGTFVFEPLHVHATYLQQWNLALEKQFGKDWLVSATYLGNKTTHQWLGRELDPAIYIPGTVPASGPTAACPGKAVGAPCSTTSNTNARRALVQANPATGKYYGSTIMTDDSGNGSYNGLLLAVNHRFSQNFSALANYTWSHCFNQGDSNQDIVQSYQDPANRQGEWGNCSADRRHLVNLSLVAQTPKFSSDWVQRFAGNWQFSSIFTFTTGQYQSVTDGTDVSLTNIGNDRPNLVGNPVSSAPTSSAWFNTLAFTKQATGTFGNAPRNDVVGPSNWNLDAGLVRTFPVRERIKLDVRFEAFNVLNHTRFNVPVTALNSAHYGQILSARDPRILQLALKLSY